MLLLRIGLLLLLMFSGGAAIGITVIPRLDFVDHATRMVYTPEMALYALVAALLAFTGLLLSGFLSPSPSHA